MQNNTEQRFQGNRMSVWGSDGYVHYHTCDDGFMDMYISENVTSVSSNWVDVLRVNHISIELIEKEKMPDTLKTVSDEKRNKAKRYIRLCRGNLNLGCRILLPKPFILSLICQSSAETKQTEKTLRTDQCAIASGKIQSIRAEPVSSDVYDQKIWMTYLEEVHTHTHTHKLKTVPATSVRR